jgi:hypothetical protein
VLQPAGRLGGGFGPARQREHGRQQTDRGDGAHQAADLHGVVQQAMPIGHTRIEQGDEHAEQERDADQIQHTLENDRREGGRGAETLPAREQVRPDHFPGPGRQQERGTEADDRRAKALLKLTSPIGSEQSLPPDGPDAHVHEVDDTGKNQQARIRASDSRHTPARSAWRRNSASSATASSARDRFRTTDRMSSTGARRAQVPRDATPACGGPVTRLHYTMGSTFRQERISCGGPNPLLVGAHPL